MKKKKKGFTLIELLAIIVILAIIAVITVPIILNVIDQSKKGAIKDSAYGYKDAINKFYLSELSKDFKDDLKLNGVYAINGIDGSLVGDSYYPIKTSGNTPTNGYMIIQNNIATGCLQFDEYRINIINGNVGNAEKANCDKIIISRQNEGEITQGDKVIIGTETFTVINSTTEKTTLLANYNLYVGNRYTAGSNEVSSISTTENGYGLQNPLAKGYVPLDSEIIGTMAFSENPYWYGEEGGVEVSLKQKYGESANASDLYDEDYDTATGNNYSVAYYINQYLDKLEDMGAPNGTEGRIPTYADYYGLLQNNPSIVYNGTSYWLASVYSHDNVDHILSSPVGFGYARYDNNQLNGIRPIIIIPTETFSE